MRTDIIIDRKQVEKPGLSIYGYGKWKIQFGDIVQYQLPGESGKTITGRVICRIASGKDQGNGQSLENLLIVMQLSSDLMHWGEFWIDPSWIVNCYNPQDIGGRDIGKRMVYFFGKDFRSKDVENLRLEANLG